MIIWILSFCTAFVPVIFWYIILTRSKRNGMQFFFWAVFVIAMVFAYIWKLYIESSLTDYLSSFFGLFIVFIIVGGLIEYSKNIIVRFIGHNFFHNLQDVIDLSFATALGFTAMENIFAFHDIYSSTFSYGSPIVIVKEVLSRSFFIIPIHLFCSGIFGYYYGLSLFALPDIRKSWGKLYSHIQVLKGTIISLIVYGLFFYIMAQDFRVRDISVLFGYPDFPFNESLFPIIAFLFSSAGTLILFQLIEHHSFVTETKEEREKREETELEK